MPPSEGSGLGPALPRRRLGAELRRLRDERRKKLTDVATDLLISTSKLSRIEKGHTTPKERDLRDLLRYYGQTDTDVGAQLRRWAEESRDTPWWQDEVTDVPSIIEQYVQYEAAADLIKGYVVHFVPTLLQTADYARAMIAALDSDDPDEIAKLVELWLRRQEVLSRAEQPVSMDFVIDESVFHRMVGSPHTMRAQLDKLAAATALPNVVLRVYPYSAGPHKAITAGTFTLFHFQRAIDPDIVNFEGMVTVAFIDQPERVAIYRELLDNLGANALTPAESAEFIGHIAQSYY